MRKTKIICTLGPATDAEGVLEKLVQEGMDVARFNFSHGSHEEQKKRLDMLREISGKKSPVYRRSAGHQGTGDPDRLF